MMFRRTVWFGVLAAAVVLVGVAGRAEAQTKMAPATADQAVKDVLAGLADNKPVVVWQAMPAGYQKDIKALISQAADKMDAEIYDKAFEILKKAVKLLKDKKSFILEGSLGKSADAVAIDQKKRGEAYDATVAFLETLFTSELSTLDGLKKADVEKFLTGTGAKLMKQVSTFDQYIDKSKLPPGGESMTSLPALFKGVKVTVVKAGATETTLKMESPQGKKAEEQVFVKVEGKWVPKEMADGWAGAMKKAKDGLAENVPPIPPETKKMILGGFGEAEKAIDKLNATKTKEEFTSAVEDIFKPLVEMVKPFLPPAPKR